MLRKHPRSPQLLCYVRVCEPETSIARRDVHTAWCYADLTADRRQASVAVETSFCIDPEVCSHNLPETAVPGSG